jgi:hypothetical protein
MEGHVGERGTQKWTLNAKPQIQLHGGFFSHTLLIVL